MKKILMIAVMVAALALPTMAQSYEAQKQQQVAAPAAGFRSTSVLQGSGSAYSSNPSLEANGTASAPAARVSGGPHRAPDPLGTEDDIRDNPYGSGTEVPVGDAVLPLTLLACAYLIIRVARRRKEVE